MHWWGEVKVFGGRTSGRFSKAACGEVDNSRPMELMEVEPTRRDATENRRERCMTLSPLVMAAT